jgi:hypothetical protein
VVLIITTLVVFWWLQPENRLDIDREIFHVQELRAVSKLELKSETEKVTLAFDNGRWRVNDRYDADANMISVLFATLQQAVPKRAVAGTLQDSVFRHLIRSGVKVSLYSGDELRKEFYAGGNEKKTQAFFGDPVSREAYVMTIPGYRVYVSGIFELAAEGWRDKFVFGFNWRNFKSLDVQFPGRPSENFNVSMSGDLFGVKGLATDTAKLNTFLDNLSLLTVDEYPREPGLRDSLQKTQPRIEFIVTDIGNRTYRLRLYHSESKSVPGLIQDSDMALFDAGKIQPLLKPKSFFVKK